MNSERKYIRGFNNGYMLANYEPNLLNTISKNLAPFNNDYLIGLLDGKKQLVVEKKRIQLFELQQLRHQSQNKEKNLER